MIGMSCSCRLELRCSVCRQAMNEEQARKDTIRAILFGNRNFAICCCCLQEVRCPEDRFYQQRWLEWRADQIRHDETDQEYAERMKIREWADFGGGID